MNNCLHFLNVLLIVTLAIGEVSSCAKSPVTVVEPAYWPTHDWRSSSPEDQGMDSELLVKMLGYIADNDINLHSLLIVRNGHLVTEAYWQPYGPSDKHSVESLTKSVIGTLIGIAIDRGQLKSTEQKILDFFPKHSIPNLDSDKKSITLANLLSMTPGIACEDTKVSPELDQTGDWVRYLLNRPMSSKPGTKWIYCSGTAHLLSAVLQEETGMDARTYANKNLFAPLEVPQVSEQDWRSDPRGITDGRDGLYLTPRDLAKYGYVYLNMGKWDSQQIVSTQWVQQSTREQAYIGQDEYVGGLDRRFGYFWSIFPQKHYYGNLGSGGQELFVVPQQNMVIVFTGALRVGEEGLLLNLVNDFIIPSIHSKSSIPANSESNSHLESLIHAAEDTKQAIPELPKIASEISDLTYKFDSNRLGWSDMTFHFRPGSDEAILTMTESPDLKIGLDNRYRLTEMSNDRPIGLRGKWIEPVTFYLDYIIFGEFIRNEAWITFGQSEITIKINYLNWNNPPIVIHGKLQG